MKGELQKLIEAFKQEEDFPDWGWGCQAIQLISDRIDEAREEFPKRIVINAEKPLTLQRVTNQLQENWAWFQKWCGDEKYDSRET